MRVSELLYNLEACVASSDDEDGAVRDLAWPSVVGAVDLEDLGGEVAGERGHTRILERPCRDDNLVRLDRLAFELDEEFAVLTVE